MLIYIILHLQTFRHITLQQDEKEIEIKKKKLFQVFFFFFFWRNNLYSVFNPYLFKFLTVRMLQASDKMRVHIREPDQLDQPNQRHIRRRLHALEQWPDTIVLLMLFMQGRLTC